MWTLPAGLMRQAASGSIAATITGILTAPDPMQALIDAMSFGTKPTYMWGGNEASGATEIGGSGFDLTAIGITQEQTSAVLGSGDFSVFDADGDHLSNTSDASLRVGSGSFAALWVGNITSGTANHIFSDYNGVAGWTLQHGAGTQHRFYVHSASGIQTVIIAGTVPTGVGEVLLGIKDSNALQTHMHTSLGTGTTSSIHNETLDNAGPKLSVGDGNTGNAARQEFGIAALWKGAAAESLTQTHRNNLATYLGF